MGTTQGAGCTWDSGPSPRITQLSAVATGPAVCSVSGVACMVVGRGLVRQGGADQGVQTGGDAVKRVTEEVADQEEEDEATGDE